MELKKCSKCGEWKSLEKFAIKRASKDGRNSRCKECDKKVSAQYRVNHPEKANASSRRSKQKHSVAVKARLKKHYQKNSVRIMDQMKEALKKNPSNGLFKLAKGRAKKANLPFSISVDDVIVPEICPILGIKMEFGNSKARANSPSLDRIIPELGYVPGNVAVISYRANRIKNDATAEEHRRIADWMDAQSQSSEKFAVKTAIERIDAVNEDRLSAAGLWDLSIPIGPTESERLLAEMNHELGEAIKRRDAQEAA